MKNILLSGSMLASAVLLQGCQSCCLPHDAEVYKWGEPSVTFSEPTVDVRMIDSNKTNGDGKTAPIAAPTRTANGGLVFRLPLGVRAECDRVVVWSVTQERSSFEHGRSAETCQYTDPPAMASGSSADAPDWLRDALASKPAGTVAGHVVNAPDVLKAYPLQLSWQLVRPNTPGSSGPWRNAGDPDLVKSGEAVLDTPEELTNPTIELDAAACRQVAEKCSADKELFLIVKVVPQGWANSTLSEKVGVLKAWSRQGVSVKDFFGPVTTNAAR